MLYVQLLYRGKCVTFVVLCSCDRLLYCDGRAFCDYIATEMSG